MKAILDTHTLLWLVDESDKLPKAVRTFCEDTENELYLSIASLWELSIKMSLGKIELPENALLKLKQWCDNNAVSILPINLHHCILIQTLPFHHRDPFDRLIIAQAIHEKLQIISCDEHFPQYNVDVFW